MQITYPITYFPSNWNILTFFTTFRFASFHFIIFCASWVLSCEFTLSKGKNFEERLCLQPRQFVSILLHLRLANYCSSAGFRFPRDPVMVGFVNLAEQTVVEDFIVGNLRTTTTTGSEIPCTAQARLANFVVVVSSTTPNTVESRRPAIHNLWQV